MVKKYRRLAACVFTVFLGLQIMTVHAEEGAAISLSGSQTEEGRLDVSCMIENAREVTNGKMRIYYDADMVTLVETKAGDALSGAMTEINDCLTGNKEEGEIVGVFASAQDIASDGSLFDMGFELKDGVEEGDEIQFEVKCEKLSGDNGDVDAQVSTAVFTVGGAMTDGGTEGDDKDDADNSSESDRDESAGGEKTNSTIKTGDEANVFYYILAAAGAAAAAGGTVVYRAKKRR